MSWMQFSPMVALNPAAKGAEFSVKCVAMRLLAYMAFLKKIHRTDRTLRCVEVNVFCSALPVYHLQQIVSGAFYFRKSQSMKWFAQLIQNVFG